MKIKSNLSKEEREILKGLKDDVSIIICPADKGKAVVVEDRDGYMEKTKVTISQQREKKKMEMMEFKDRRHFPTCIYL